MADWTPPTDAVETLGAWTPPSDAVETGNNPDTRIETKGHTFKQYDPKSSLIGRLFGKYAPDVLDVITGSVGTLKGAANLISPGSVTNTGIASSLGLPYEPDKNSLAYVAGQITDPAALAIGGGVGKVVQAVPAIARATQAVNAAQAARTAGAVVPAVTKGSQVLAHVVAPAVTGAATGGATGYLASEGDLQDAGMAALYGGALGPTVPAAFRAVKQGGGFLTDLAQGAAGKVRAGQIAREAAGANLPAIRGALTNAPQNLTAGQATFGINQDPWQALGKYGAERDTSSYYRTLAEQQAAARQGMLTSVTPDLAAAEATRTGTKNAMYPGAFAADEARRAAATVGPVKPEMVVTNPNAGTGYYKPAPPLKPNVPPALAGIANEPIILGAAKDAADVIRTDPNIPEAVRATLTGNPMGSVQGLHAMKIAIDNQLTNPNTLSALGKYSQSSLKAIRKQLISAIGDISPEYDAARTTFAQLSKPVNQAKVLGNLSETLAAPLESGAERAVPFANALGRGEGSALKRAGLDIRFGDTADVLTQPQMQTVNTIRDQLARDQAIGAQAKAGAGGLEIAMKDTAGKFRLPNLFNQKVALANKFLETADKYLSNESIKAISEGMRNGKSALEMLDTLPAADRNRWLLWAGQTGQTLGNMGVPGAVVGTSKGQ